MKAEPMTEQTYPYMARASYDLEVARPRNGRPGYAWVPAWIVHYSSTRESMAMRLAEARSELKRARDERG
jgi:hypothetical protein